jgi:hypothetical protein
MVYWYVDSSVNSSGNGKSWATAWKNISDINSLSNGDTVYISGGPTGSTQTYALNTWTPQGGTYTNPITYKIGQDTLHNGIAYFNGTASTGLWLANADGVIISGDAGDGKMHFTLADPSTNQCSYNAMLIDCSSDTPKSGMRISYINFGICSGGGPSWRVIDIRTMTNLEIDHTWAYLTEPTLDAYAYIHTDFDAWDIRKFHHNTIDIPTSHDGMGPDGIQSFTGSIYNNMFLTHFQNYTGSQHSDGYQVLGGSYIKVYNNIFKNWANYAIYIDAYYGDFSHVWIYNNIIVIDDIALQQSWAPAGIAVGPEGGNRTFTDVVIANNIVADYVNHSAGGMGDAGSWIATCINCITSNNIAINSIKFDSKVGVTQEHNITISSADAINNFVKYVINGGLNNDYHLKSSATTLIDMGTNLGTYFTIDMDGISRPQGTGWDIGAYEYFSGVCPTPIVGFTINIL